MADSQIIAIFAKEFRFLVYGLKIVLGFSSDTCESSRRFLKQNFNYSRKYKGL